MNAEVQEVTDTGMRASGLLLPIFSLPGKYGIGCFSDEAYRFVDFVKEAGQKYWQILPVGPTGYGDSPYQSFFPPLRAIPILSARTRLCVRDS